MQLEENGSGAADSRQTSANSSSFSCQRREQGLHLLIFTMACLEPPGNLFHSQRFHSVTTTDMGTALQSW